MKVLIAYDSKAGHMEKMAQFMAEGARFAGANVEVEKISEIKEAEALQVTMRIFAAAHLPPGYDQQHEDLPVSGRKS
jgi:NAD(P)H dehydrogenase (quinone)